MVVGATTRNVQNGEEGVAWLMSRYYCWFVPFIDNMHCMRGCVCERYIRRTTTSFLMLLILFLGFAAVSGDVNPGAAHGGKSEPPSNSEADTLVLVEDTVQLMKLDGYLRDLTTELGLSVSVAFVNNPTPLSNDTNIYGSDDVLARYCDMLKVVTLGLTMNVVSTAFETDFAYRM